MTGASPRFRINPFREELPSRAGSPGAARGFHASVPGYHPTRLVRLDGLARETGLGAVYVKDESSRFGLGAFKALGASWAVQKLLVRGDRLTTLASATDGNHGRAVAWTARRLGLRAVIFMTTHSSPARIEAIRGEGAEVVLVEGTYDDAVRHCAVRSAEAGWQVIADVGYAGYLEIPGLITEGYETLFGELVEQLDEQGWDWPDVVILQAGVGGFAAAGVQYLRACGRPVRVAVVEPVDADPVLASALTDHGVPAPSAGHQRSLMACLNCGTVSLAAWPVLRAGVDVFFSIEDRWAEAAMRRLARPADGDSRIVSGESGSAGLAGVLALLADPALDPARQALALGPEARVLIVNTEGATDPGAFQRIAGQAP